MKRSLSEWGLIGSTLALIVFALLWAGSYFVDRTMDHLQVDTTGQVQDALHLILRRGEFWACDQFVNDAAGLVQPLVFDPVNPGEKNVPGAARVVLPFFEGHYCRLASNQDTIWSLRLSLWLPTALSALSAAWFARRVVRSRRRAASPGRDPEGATP